MCGLELSGRQVGAVPQVFSLGTGNSVGVLNDPLANVSRTSTGVVDWCGSGRARRIGCLNPAYLGPTLAYPKGEEGKRSAFPKGNAATPNRAEQNEITK